MKNSTQELVQRTGGRDNDPNDPLTTCSINSFRFNDRTLSLLDILDLGGSALDGTNAGPSIYGTSFADVIQGTSKGEHIYGGLGDDTINAGGGYDVIYGGSGTIVGEAERWFIGEVANDAHHAAQPEWRIAA